MADDEKLAAIARIEEAITAYAVACEGPGDMLTGWVVTATLTSAELLDEDSTAYLRISPSNQAYHSTIGLLSYHTEHLHREMLDD